MTQLVQDYFRRSAKRTPDRIAVRDRDSSVTYGELDRQTNATANALRKIGVVRGEFVPIFIEKSTDAIRSILAVLKCDCAYVPLDTTSPRERIVDILRASNARFVLINSESLPAFEVIAQGLNITAVDIGTLPKGDVATVECENLSIDIAYVLFTSGSTGTPKGVMISHQMIVDYIDWCLDLYGVTGEDRVANHAPLYFDNSTFDIYTAFAAGAELHLVHSELNAVMQKLASWLEERRITVFFCVPSVLNILLRSGRVTFGRYKELRHVVAAGEVLQPLVLREWMLALPHAKFTNMYGPTEITVDCTFHVVSEVPDAGAPTVPIGRARRNMEVFVRLSDGSLSNETGAEGEIAVRGASVAYGYLNNPEKTAAAFIQNPRHSLFHDPIYLTGDLARIGDDGSFIFLGRKDQQIKYMGNRIELGEIETALGRAEGVTDCVVVFNDSPDITAKCIGALVCVRAPATEASLYSELGRLLPIYMRPKRIVLAEAIPRTPNGKADRLAAFKLLFP